MSYFEVVQRSNVEIYGLDIIVTRASGPTTAGLRGIFRARHEAIDPQTSAKVLIDKPTLDVVLQDMPGGDLAASDKVSIPVQNSVPVVQNFVITEVVKDGEGMAKCMLQWDE